jgi:formylglycine-generating enzyme required for sulfatase activity/tRNA A-37 threonylcarbamoyl transferase component Bud32
MPDHQYALPPGTYLGHYQIQSLLGHGGFGLTYLAKDLKLHRLIAIKELLPMDFAVREAGTKTVVPKSFSDQTNLEWARQRFLEEGRTLASLHHPSILPVYEILQENATAYLVTGYVEGGDFLQWLAKHGGAVSEAKLRLITIELLGALSKVHANGYLHRDLKPQNILMNREEHPILIDFGNARMSTGERTQSMTAILTPGYAPFEQYTTSSRQGPWTDIYSLGAVLYRAITGKQPPDAADRIENDPLVPLSAQATPRFSRPFLASIDKAMQSRASARWQSAEAWSKELTNPSPQTTTNYTGSGPTRTSNTNANTKSSADQRPPISGPPPLPPLPPQPKKRGAIIALIACIFLIIGGGILAFWQPTPAVEEHNSGSLAITPAKEPVVPAKEEPKVPPTAPPTTTPPKAAPPKPELATKARPYVNSVGLEMIPVPGSHVLMARTETRVQDFRKFAKATNYQQLDGINVLKVKNREKDGYSALFEVDSKASWEKPGFTQTDTHPVVGISYAEAKEFCAWLGKEEGLTYRLPSDEEWSNAAGVGRYPWGSVWPEPKPMANYGGTEFIATLPGKGWKMAHELDDGAIYTAAVASYPANRLGFYDLSGNALEWCQDVYRASLNSPENLATNAYLKSEQSADGTPNQIVRGGSWFSYMQTSVASCYRDYDPATRRSSNLGFRVVCVLPTPTVPAKPNPATVKQASLKEPFINSLGQELVPIPGTKILMCRTETRVKDFKRYADAAPYTQRGGITVMKVTGTEAEGFKVIWEQVNATWEQPGFAQTPDHPVVCVSNKEAKDFCVWLGKQEGLTYRLPTDQEWTQAAGAGPYPWGQDWPPPPGAGNYVGQEFKDSLPESPKTKWNIAYTNNDGSARTGVVGSYMDNKYGIFDLGGNVWEHCEDPYKSALNTKEILDNNPSFKEEVDADGQPKRFRRGSSWHDWRAVLLNVTLRLPGPATSRFSDEGFRIVCEIPQ